MNKPRPKPGERKYVALDRDTGLFCIFGEASGFAYASYSSASLADEALSDLERAQRQAWISWRWEIKS